MFPQKSVGDFVGSVDCGPSFYVLFRAKGKA